MAKYKRYSDEFLSRAGVVWRIEIWQESDEPFAVKGFDCEADQSLTIEWGNQAKEEPLCGSTATLRLESPGDRTYIDLYTINPGDIRLDVYRADVLFWSGLLDPEFYEEPYERAANYPVSLTFSDFGILDRLKYDLEGIKTIKAVLDESLERAGLNLTAIDTSLISTSIDDADTPFTLDNIAVDSANWFDEEGEASTLKEVLTGMFQPLGLRMIQRAGKLWIYDLNGLHDGATSKQIEWSGDSSTLSVDKVLNNVVVTFSPYGSSTLADNEMSVEDVTPGTFDWKTINVFDQQASLAGFRIGWANMAKSNLTLYNGAKFFKISPLWTKEECAGVLWGFTTHPDNNWSTWQTYFNAPERLFPIDVSSGHYLGSTKAPVKSTINTRPIFSFTTPMINISGMELGVERNLLLSVEVLLDMRYNPFEDDNEHNRKDVVDSYKNHHNVSVIWMPVRVLLRNAQGDITHHYVNTTWFYTDGHENYIEGSGYWATGAGGWGDALLSYYSEDLKNEMPIGGWRKNKRFIGRGKKDLPNMLNWRRTPDGEYLPIPPQSGYIEVQVGSGVYSHNYWGELSDPTGSIFWTAFKNPSIEFTDGMGEKIDSEDIEYSGYINKAAKDALELSTVCGTHKADMISAKGVYHSTISGKPIETFKRAGRSGVCEKLLIGSLYSQYANRHTTLSGEVEINPTGINTYTEVNQDDRKFIMSGEVMDALADTSEASFIELSPDNYDAIEEVN